MGKVRAGVARGLTEDDTILHGVLIFMVVSLSFPNTAKNFIRLPATDKPNGHLVHAQPTKRRRTVHSDLFATPFSSPFSL